MEDHLRRLVRLQRLEDRLTILRRRAAGLPAELSERAAHLAALEAEVEQVAAERQQALARAQDLENRSVTHEERIAKLEAQLRETRDPAAAEVARHEVEGLRQQVSAEQEEALGLLESAEGLAERHRALAARLEEAREDLERFRETVAADEAELETEIAGLLGRRDAILAELPSDARAHFESLSEQGRGKIAVPMKADSCGGCGTRLVPNDAMKVRSRKLLHRCPSCARFLVAPDLWNDEAEDAAGA